MNRIGYTPEEEGEQVDGWTMDATTPNSAGGEVSNETVGKNGNFEEASGNELAHALDKRLRL